MYVIETVLMYKTKSHIMDALFDQPLLADRLPTVKDKLNKIKNNMNNNNNNQQNNFESQFLADFLKGNV
jgi:hypothetical protein